MTITMPIIALLLVFCVWMYRIARDAERQADAWKQEAQGWEDVADRARAFAQDAIDSLAARQEELDRKDAEIVRLYGACKRLSENEQYKHRLWVQAQKDVDMARRQAALESVVNLPTAGWSATWEN